MYSSAPTTLSTTRTGIGKRRRMGSRTTFGAESWGVGVWMGTSRPKQEKERKPLHEGKQIKEGRHVGLDFYDLLIEALQNQAGANKRRTLMTRLISTA